MVNKIFSNKFMDKYLLDSWSFIHFNSMFIIFNILNLIFDIKKSIILSVIIGISWELFENSNIGIKFWNKHNYPEYNGDSFINIIGDIIVDLLGIYIGYKISFIQPSERLKYIICIFIILELIPYYLSKVSIIFTLYELKHFAIL